MLEQQNRVLLVLHQPQDVCAFADMIQTFDVRETISSIMRALKAWLLSVMRPRR